MAELFIDCFIGFDPGASGGIAVWKPNEKVKVYKMPKDLFDLRPLFKNINDTCEYPLVFLEKVSLRPDDMTSDVPGKAYRIQSMLSGFQKIKDILQIENLPFILVHPMSWQSTLHLRVKGESKPQRKLRYKNAAAEYYPEVKATLWNSDALLLMHFGRNKKMNDPNWIISNLPKVNQPQLEFNQNKSL